MMCISFFEHPLIKLSINNGLVYSNVQNSITAVLLSILCTNATDFPHI